MEDFKNEMHKLAQDKNMAFKLGMDLKKTQRAAQAAREYELC